MKNRNPICLFALAMAMLFMGLPQTAHAAGPLTPGQVAMEIMMHSQGEDAAFIAAEIGVDPNSALTYSTNVDPAGQTFTFSLKPGTTYQGRSLSLNASGQLNPSTQSWNVVSTGAYGGTQWTVTSNLVPAASANTSTLAYKSTASFNSSGIIQDIQLYNGISCTPIFGYWNWGWSEESCTLTWNGQPIGTPWLASDGYSNWGWWNWYWVSNVVYLDFSLSAQGSTPLEGGAGSFTTFIAPAQQPCAPCSDGSGSN